MKDEQNLQCGKVTFGVRVHDLWNGFWCYRFLYISQANEHCDTVSKVPRLYMSVCIYIALQMGYRRRFCSLTLAAWLLSSGEHSFGLASQVSSSTTLVSRRNERKRPRVLSFQKTCSFISVPNFMRQKSLNGQENEKQEEERTVQSNSENLRRIGNLPTNTTVTKQMLKKISKNR